MNGTNNGDNFAIAAFYVPVSYNRLHLIQYRIEQITYSSGPLCQAGGQHTICYAYPLVWFKFKSVNINRLLEYVQGLQLSRPLDVQFAIHILRQYIPSFVSNVECCIYVIALGCADGQKHKSYLGNSARWMFLCLWESHRKPEWKRQMWFHIVYHVTPSEWSLVFIVLAWFSFMVSIFADS